MTTVASSLRVRLCVFLNVWKGYIQMDNGRWRNGCVCVLGVTGATNSVFELRLELVSVVRCQQDITAIKGLRHMVIQIQFRYSQHTRLQQKERRIGQVNRLAHRKGALSSSVANKSFMSSFLFIAITHACTSPPCFCILTLYVCKTHRKQKPTGMRLSFLPHQPEQINKDGGLHFKMATVKFRVVALAASIFKM